MSQNWDIYGIQKGKQHFRSEYSVRKLVYRVGAFYLVGYVQL